CSVQRDVRTGQLGDGAGHGPAELERSATIPEHASVELVDPESLVVRRNEVLREWSRAVWEPGAQCVRGAEILQRRYGFEPQLPAARAIGDDAAPGGVQCAEP